MHVELNVQDQVDQMFPHFYDQYVGEEIRIAFFHLDQLEQVQDVVFLYYIDNNKFLMQEKITI